MEEIVFGATPPVPPLVGRIASRRAAATRPFLEMAQTIEVASAKPALELNARSGQHKVHMNTLTHQASTRTQA